MPATKKSRPKAKHTSPSRRPKVEAGVSRKLDFLIKGVESLRGEVMNLQGEVADLRKNMATKKEIATLATKMDMEHSFAVIHHVLLREINKQQASKLKETVENHDGEKATNVRQTETVEQPAQVSDHASEIFDTLAKLHELNESMKISSEERKRDFEERWAQLQSCFK